MPFSAKIVANEFLKLADASGKKISPMKLQKLVYFAHGWFLALTGQPLIEERIQAWQFGPVIPELYRQFKDFGNGSITRYATDVQETREAKLYFPFLEDRASDADTDRARALIQRVWDVYGDYSAVKLSNATHVDGSPWSKVFNPEEHYKVINDSTIRDYFLQLAKNG